MIRGAVGESSGVESAAKRLTATASKTSAATPKSAMSIRSDRPRVPMSSSGSRN
jgi:hypothetical protein